MTCTICGKKAYSQFCMQHKPRKPLTTRKAINRVGPVTAKWIETRHQWIQQNATPTGIWNCYICEQRLAVEADPEQDIMELTLDHVKSRTRHPELRFVMSNLAPCCPPCNREKGSLSLEEYLARKEEYGRYQSGRS